MSANPRPGQGYSGPVFFSFGFRPFFFCAALFAAVAIPFWALIVTGRLTMAGGSLDPVRWHAHEMIFGYLGAVIAGFLLTAIPNWTGRPPISGAPLASLLALWVIGRAGAVLQATGMIAPAFGAVVELAFWFALIGMAAREIVAAGNRRALPVIVLIAVFGIADAVFLLPDWLPYWRDIDPMLGARLALAVAASLISLLGGRLTPTFTRNWLLKQKGESLAAAFGPIDKAAIAGTVLAVFTWAFLPAHPAAGGLLLLAGLLQMLRLSRWRMHRTLAEPLVTILHLGYAWLVVALLALAASILAPERIAPESAIHALTAGAIGTMTLAVMTRATLGHTGRLLTADLGTRIIYALVILGAALRVAAGWLPTDYAETTACAGVIWSSAFLLFAVKYGRYLLAPAKPAA